MIRVEGVSKRFEDRVVLDDVDLEVGDGKLVVILGPSGIGKTVLLRIMAGLLPADAGTVSYDGRPLRFGAFSDNRPILEQLGYVFQSGALFDSLNVFDNVALPLRENSRLGAKELKSRVRAALDRVGMAQHEALPVSSLSGGMVRLVALARALACSPRYVFYDEPTTGLDPVMRDRILDLVVSLRDNEGQTGIAVTHDLAAAERMADRIYMLKDRRLVVLGGRAGKEHYEA